MKQVKRSGSKVKQYSTSACAFQNGMQNLGTSKHQMIHVISAEVNEDTDYFSNPNIYFICRIGSINSDWDQKGIESECLQFKSEIIQKHNPKWNAKFSIDLSDEWVQLASETNEKGEDDESLELDLKLYNYDSLTKYDLVGLSTNIPISTCGTEGPIEYPIRNENKPIGLVRLKFGIVDQHIQENCTSTGGPGMKGMWFHKLFCLIQFLINFIFVSNYKN